MDKKLKKIMIAAFFGFLVVACVDSAGDLDAPPTPPGKLFYQSGSIRVRRHHGSISMVDSENPSAPPVIIETGNTQEARTFLDGRVDVPNRQITDFHLRTVIYGNKDDGRLYKISALATESATRIQVSNEANAAAMCDAHLAKTEPDWSDHNKSIYLYRMPGADTNCSTADDLFKMVRLNMTASDEPILAKEMLGPSRDERGAIIGFLAIDGNEVVRYDRNFQNRQKIISFLSRAEELKSFFSEGNKFLWIDNQVYHYKETTHKLSLPRHTFSHGVPFSVLSVSDEKTMYFTDGYDIFEIPLDGSTPASLIASEIPIGFRHPIQGIRLTNNSLIYDASFIDSTGQKPIQRQAHSFNATLFSTIKAVNKTTRITRTLVQPTLNSLESVFFGSFVAGDFIYYNRAASGFFSFSKARGLIKDDGSQGILVDGEWMGATTRAISPQGIIFDKLIWLEDCISSLDCSGRTIRSIDAATHGDELILGTISSNIGRISTFTAVNEGNLVTEGTRGGLDKDMVYLNPSQAGSLMRITTTPGFSESRIFYNLYTDKQFCLKARIACR